MPCLPHYPGCDGKRLGTALAGPWQCSPDLSRDGQWRHRAVSVPAECPQQPRLHGRAQEASVELLPAQPSATGSLQGCLWKGIVGQAQGPIHCEPGSSGRLGTKTRKERKEMGSLLGIVSSSCRNRRAHDSAPFCLQSPTPDTACAQEQVCSARPCQGSQDARTGAPEP